MFIDCFFVSIIISTIITLFMSLITKYAVVAFIPLTFLFTVLLLLIFYYIDYDSMLDNRLTYKWENASFADIKKMMYSNIDSVHYITSNEFVGFYNDIKINYPKIDDQKFERCGIYEYYTDTKIYKNGIIYILSFQDLIRYQSELNTFKEKLEKNKKQRNRSKKELAIQKNKIREES